MTTGERIKARREELGLSVDDVATKLGKHRATIYRYESNDIETFPADVLIPLARVLNVSPVWLLGLEDFSAPDDEKALTPTSEDERTREFILMFEQLTEAEQVLVIAQIKGILASRGWHPEQPPEA